MISDLPPNAVSDDAQPRDQQAHNTNEVGQLLLRIEAGVVVVVDRRKVDDEVQSQADSHHRHADDDETGQTGDGPATRLRLYG